MSHSREVLPPQQEADQSKAEAQGTKAGEQVAKTSQTLEELRARDRELRSALEGQFGDDESFQALTAELMQHLAKLESSALTGIEKARAFAAAERVFGELRATDRGAASREFVSESMERERAEEEVDRLKRMQQAQE